MTSARIALILMLALGAPAAAQTPGPACTLQRHGLVEIFRGVLSGSAIATCGTATSTVHLIRVDLATPGLSFTTSGSANGGPGPFTQELPTAFLQRTKTQVAFNANLFTNCCCYDVPANQPVQTNLVGLEISGGQILSQVQAIPPSLPGNCGAATTGAYPFDHSLLVRGKALRIEQFEKGAQPQADAAVTGSHVLVSGGQNKAPPNNSGSFYGPTARTLVGLGADNGVLWIAAVDGYAPSQGVTLWQGAQIMLALDAASAINLDGGGSTSLAIEGGDGMPRLLNVPKDNAGSGASCSFMVGDRCERYVGVSFGIKALPTR
jgi:hypothetical protein